MNVRLFCLITSLAMLAAGWAAAQPGLLKSEFIYQTAPFPECHASTLVETTNGLTVAWFGGSKEGNRDVCIWVSRLETNAWTAPAKVASGAVGTQHCEPTWNPVLFQPRNGSLFLFYKVGPSPETWKGMYKTSEDCGKTWSACHALPDGILGPIKNKPVQLANGDIVSPSSIEGPHGWQVHFELSKDSCKTWTATPPLNDGKKIGAIQPSILCQQNGSLLALGRTKQKRIFQITSADKGQTWSPMSLTSLPNPNSGIDAVTLRDGRFLLVYNHSTKRRSPLNVAISKDGKVWQAALVLEDDDKAPNGFAYPAVIQTTDGLVHITYTWKRLRIKHIVMDPASVHLTSIAP